MSARTFKVTVLERFCKGCGLCVAACREDALRRRTMPNDKGVRVAEPTEADCTGCLRCATICPDAAIEVTRYDLTVESVPGGQTDQ